MKKEFKYSALVAALLALGLAGCQKQEEVPAPDSDTTVVVPAPDSDTTVVMPPPSADVPGSEAPAPEAAPPAETIPPPESAPGTSGAPGEMSDTPTTPAQ